MNDSFINCTVAETQYRIVLNVSLRDFTSAIGTNLVQIEVNVHSPAEFIQAVWNKSVNHIHRGIIFSTNDTGELSCSWMDESDIVINNIGNYLQLYDINSHRPIDWINRNNNLSNITGTKLQSMMNRSISLYIFKYSHHIVSKVNYDFAKKTLIDPVQT